jgi:hypothetical protein
MIMALIVACLIVYISVANVPQLKERAVVDAEKIELLEEDLANMTRAWTASSMEIDNLEEIIKSKDELILQLRIKEEVLELYKKALETAYTYVYYTQGLLDAEGIAYAEFIVDSVLDDLYLEEIEEQIEFFESLEE